MKNFSYKYEYQGHHDRSLHVVTKQKMCTAKLTSILILAVQTQCILFPRNALLQRCATYIPSRTPSGQRTGKTPFALQLGFTSM